MLKSVSQEYFLNCYFFDNVDLKITFDYLAHFLWIYFTDCFEKLDLKLIKKLRKNQFKNNYMN